MGHIAHLTNTGYGRSKIIVQYGPSGEKQKMDIQILHLFLQIPTL